MKKENKKYQPYSIEDAPKSLEDTPFYSLKLDKDQQKFRDAIYDIVNHYDSEICNIEIDSDKTSLKNKIESGRDITVAEVINKESLIIK